MVSTTPYFIDKATRQDKLVSTSSLVGKHAVDFLVVGGGMAGIAVTHTLAERLPPDTSIALVEQAPALAMTTTGKAGGFIADHIDDDYCDTDPLINAQLRQGIEGIVRAATTHHLSCDLQELPSLYAAREPAHVRAVVQEYQARCNGGFSAQLLDEEAGKQVIGFDTLAQVMVHQGTRHIDPLAFVSDLARSLQKRSNLKIYTSTSLLSLDKQHKKARTSQGEISYGTALVTAGGGGPDLGFLRHKVFFWRDVVAVTEPLTDEQVLAVWPNNIPSLFWDGNPNNYIYAAPLADRRLLFGGGTDLSQIVSITEARNQKPLDTAVSYTSLRALLYEAFPSLAVLKPHISHIWSGVIPMSVDSLPFLGETNNDHFVALYNQNLPAAFRAGELIGTYAATGKSPEGLALFHYNRSIPFLRRILTLSQKKPLTTIANIFHERFG